MSFKTAQANGFATVERETVDENTAESFFSTFARAQKYTPNKKYYILISTITQLTKRIMKTSVFRLLIILSLSILSLTTFAQLRGGFNYGQDGHIYFYLTNNLNQQVPISAIAQNTVKRESRTANGIILPGNVFFFGPNYGWAWEKGETMTITYANGQSYSWVCPTTDSATQSNQRGTNNNRGNNMANHPYKCEFCNGKGVDFMGGICSICGGAGWAKMSGNGGGTQNIRQPRNPNACPTCGGKGQIKKGYGVGYITCSRCKGTGNK